MIFVALFLLFVVYSIAVYTNGTVQTLQMNEHAKRGKQLFQEFNCISCHQVYGLGGFLGADLTNIISSHGKGEEYARVFIENGTDRMPKFKFTKAETDCLIEYLRYVDQTAITYKQ